MFKINKAQSLLTPEEAEAADAIKLDAYMARYTKIRKYIFNYIVSSKTYKGEQAHELAVEYMRNNP